MLVSYVLRLISDELAGGHLVGEIEAVATGERRAVHGTDEVVGFCTETLLAAPRSWRIEDKKGER